MKKSKKVLLIVGLSLAIALGVAYIVLYCLFKVQTTKITMDVINHICNKPLPVVGVTTLVLSVALFKIIKLIITTRSIKLKQVYDELLASQREIDELSKLIKELQMENEKKYEEHKCAIKQVCKASPNKKIKKLGDTLYGKEVDSITKAKEI